MWLKTWLLSPGVQRLLMCKPRAVGRISYFTSRWQYSTNSRHPLYETVVKDNKESSWQPIYRWTVMPHIQAISRLKFALTSVLSVGCPPLILASCHDYVSKGFAGAFTFAALFSLATLVIFSYFSTKVVGVISIHRTTGMIRIGCLNFAGIRRDILVQSTSVIPPTDMHDDPESAHTIRLGILDEGDGTSQRISKTLFVTRIRSEIVDKEQFKGLLGFTW